MNAVDRFSGAMARYRQQVQPLPQSTYPQATAPQPAYPQPSYPQSTYPQVPYPQATYPQAVQSVQAQAPRSDVEKALDKVAEATPLLSRLASLVNRVQQGPQPATAGANPAGQAVYVPPQGPVGQSLQRLGQAVGSSDVDRFVRQAAPVIDEALPLIEDIVNFANGKPRQQATAQAGYAPYGTAPQQPSISQQVGAVVDGVSSLAAGVTSMVKAFEGLFKR